MLLTVAIASSTEAKFNEESAQASIKPVSLKVFLKQKKSWQKVYLKKYPNSSHARHFHQANWGNVTLAPRKRKKREPMGDDAIVAHKQTKEMNKHMAGTINHHSLRAARSLNDSHMAVIADTIETKRSDIINHIGNEATQYPALYKHGLDAIENMIHNAPAKNLINGDIIDGDFEEIRDITPDEELPPKEHKAPNPKLDVHSRKSAFSVLTSISKGVLLAAGVIAIASGAAPIAAVGAYWLLNDWGQSRNKHSDHKKERSAAQRRAAENRRAEEEQEKEREEMEKERLAIEKRMKKKRLALEIAKASSEQPDFVAEHEDTIHAVLDQLSDVFRLSSANDFKEHLDYFLPENTDESHFDAPESSGEEFDEEDESEDFMASASAVACNESLGGFGNYLRQLGCTFNKQGSVYTVPYVEKCDILEALNSVCPNVEVSDTDSGTFYHFGCNEFFTTACKSEAGYVFRVDEV